MPNLTFSSGFKDLDQVVSITSLADHYKVLISHTNPFILHKEASSKCRTVKNSSTLVENYTKAARSDTYFTGDIA